MAVNYRTSLKSTRMQAVINDIDSGTAGTVEIATASFASILVTIPLAKPSFTESGGVITMASMPRSATASATGTAAVARIKDSAGNVIVNNLSVGTSATDIILNSTSITSGQTVTLPTSPASTITHAA